MKKYTPNPLGCKNASNAATTKSIVEGKKCGKCSRSNENEFLHKCVNCNSDHLVYAGYCESWRLEKRHSLP